MRAYGSDRIRIADDGTIELSCRVAKDGWQPRTPPTLTRRERPGTAVLWEEECWEVVDVAELQPGVRYTMSRWRDDETMRFTSRYDEEAEGVRTAERRDAIRREKHRRTANLLGIFTGHLPGPVQQRLGHEWNINAPRLTIVSTVPEWIAAGSIVWLWADRALQQLGPPAIGWALLGGYLMLDATIRFKLAFIDERACGSLFGWIAYALWYPFASKENAVKPTESRRGEGTLIREFPPEEQLQHSLHVREPLLTLLSPAEQARIAARFDYDYRRTARKVAIGILVVAAIGIVSSLRAEAWLSLATAAIIAVEQAVRISRLAERPVGSFLGVLVRPFARKFLYGLRIEN
jgi:hypothetical protein